MRTASSSGPERAAHHRGRSGARPRRPDHCFAPVAKRRSTCSTRSAPSWARSRTTLWRDGRSHDRRELRGRPDERRKRGGTARWHRSASPPPIVDEDEDDDYSTEADVDDAEDDRGSRRRRRAARAAVDARRRDAERDGDGEAARAARRRRRGGRGRNRQRDEGEQPARGASNEDEPSDDAGDERAGRPRTVAEGDEGEGGGRNRRGRRGGRGRGRRGEGGETEAGSRRRSADGRAGDRRRSPAGRRRAGRGVESPRRVAVRKAQKAAEELGAEPGAGRRGGSCSPKRKRPRSPSAARAPRRPTTPIVAEATPVDAAPVEAAPVEAEAKPKSRAKPASKAKPARPRPTRSRRWPTMTRRPQPAPHPTKMTMASRARRLVAAHLWLKNDVVVRASEAICRLRLVDCFVASLLAMTVRRWRAVFHLAFRRAMGERQA